MAAQRDRMVSVMGPNGERRTIDYSKLLVEKENELMERDDRLHTYEERMRAAEEKAIKL